MNEHQNYLAFVVHFKQHFPKICKVESISEYVCYYNVKFICVFMTNIGQLYKQRKELKQYIRKYIQIRYNKVQKSTKLNR